MTMSAPASARARAMARPSPLLPPVTRAVRPVRLNKSETVMARASGNSFTTEARYGQKPAWEVSKLRLQVDVFCVFAWGYRVAILGLLGIGVFFRDVNSFEFDRRRPAASRSPDRQFTRADHYADLP